MRWEREATERRYIWPYNFREYVIRVSASGRLIRNDEIVRSYSCINWLPAGENELKDANVRWNIFEYQIAWDSIELELELSVEDFSQLKPAIIPVGFDPSVLFSVLVHCPATRCRFALVEPLKSNQSSITVKLMRNEIAGGISIEPTIVLGQNLSKAPSSWARTRGSIICNGFRLHIQADKPEESFGGGLEIQWEEFPVFIANALYRFIIDSTAGMKPKLYINSRHIGLQSIIDSTDKRGEKARTRDAIYALMAPDIWLKLAEFAAATDLETDDEDKELEERIERIWNLLSRNLGKSRESIIVSLNNPESRRELTEEIQHWVRTGVSVNNMVTEMQETLTEE